jgi:hypothetical protein
MLLHIDLPLILWICALFAAFYAGLRLGLWSMRSFILQNMEKLEQETKGKSERETMQIMREILAKQTERPKKDKSTDRPPGSFQSARR